MFQNVFRFRWLPILCHHWQGGGSRCACGGKGRCLHVCRAWASPRSSIDFTVHMFIALLHGMLLKEFPKNFIACQSMLNHWMDCLPLGPPIEVKTLWVFWCLIVLVALAASSVSWSLATCLAQESPPADEASDSATRSDGCKLWTWNQTEPHRHICSSIISVLRICDFSRHPDLCGGTVQFICGHAHHPFWIVKRPRSDRQRKTRKASRRRLDDDNVGWREENPSLVGPG